MSERHTISLAMGGFESKFTPTEARRIIGRLYRALTDPGPAPEHHRRCIYGLSGFLEDDCVAECPVRKAEEAQQSDYERIDSIINSVAEECGIKLTGDLGTFARRLVERGEGRCEHGYPGCCMPFDHDPSECHSGLDIEGYRAECESERADAAEAEVARLRTLCGDLAGEETLVQDGKYETEMQRLRAELAEAQRERDEARATIEQMHANYGEGTWAEVCDERDKWRAIAVQADRSSLVSAELVGERRRQKNVEGWTEGHDDTHNRGELARAAACYAIASTYAAARPNAFNYLINDRAGCFVRIWPWDIGVADGSWKPKNPRRDLVRAGALIIAEIERLDRKAGRDE